MDFLFKYGALLKPKSITSLTQKTKFYFGENPTSLILQKLEQTSPVRHMNVLHFTNRSKDVEYHLTDSFAHMLRSNRKELTFGKFFEGLNEYQPCEIFSESPMPFEDPFTL